MNPEIHCIESLLREFAALNDAGRYEELAGLFIDEATFCRPSDPDRPLRGRVAILESLLARQQAPGTSRHHMVADLVVETCDDGVARVSSASILITMDAHGAGSVSIGGYSDVLVQVNGTWRFATRRGFTTIGPLSYTAADTPPGPAGSAAAAR
ncbi:SnoaL-like protein [Comamonas sp. BIGb0124]|uniref:nuclear transport factor 2 family protein n=1 Tax=Comamonas sp. BIGb0124 TaxID=2485130 RepID=UPI000F466E42|nr:nuclear transport factor 2 family protein [Comamonas sp. BIGb0124]ROR23079.1 SnoaL-like protein [Comamonas sp. BIGb0124]